MTRIGWYEYDSLDMKRLSAALATVGYLISAGIVKAEIVDTLNLGNTQQGKGVDAGTPLDRLLQNSFTIVFAVAALTVLIFLIYGAFKWITSGGEKDGTKVARTYITNALVGLAVLALAFVILRVVGGIVGFDILTQFNIPSLDAPR